MPLPGAAGPRFTSLLETDGPTRPPHVSALVPTVSTHQDTDDEVIIGKRNVRGGTVEERGSTLEGRVASLPGMVTVLG